MALINQQENNISLGKQSSFSGLFRYITGRKKVMEALEMADPEEAEIVESLKKARTDWTNACIDFEYAEDQDLIDYHTYRIKAFQLRYEFFLKKAKEKGLKVNVVGEEAVLPVNSTHI